MKAAPQAWPEAVNDMSTTIRSRIVGPGHPCYVIAEIGINHNGDVNDALRLIDVAVLAGCDAVKFQKRTPELCTPRDQWEIERDTPWGRMTYIDYRRRIELDGEDYTLIDKHCRDSGIAWFASCWDEEALAFMEEFDPPAYKVASASLTDLDMVREVVATGKTVILSSGMSTQDQIDRAVDLLAPGLGALAHATSTYPCPPEELNLLVIPAYAARYEGLPIGYSGHEVGLQSTIAAVALGATFVERHITLDRASWGTDQAASVEPQGLLRLVRDIRAVEAAMGDGVKRVYDSEIAPMQKLRRFP